MARGKIRTIGTGRHNRYRTLWWEADYAVRFEVGAVRPQ